MHFASVTVKFSFIYVDLYFARELLPPPEPSTVASSQSRRVSACCPCTACRWAPGQKGRDRLGWPSARVKGCRIRIGQGTRSPRSNRGKFRRDCKTEAKARTDRRPSVADSEPRTSPKCLCLCLGW